MDENSCENETSESVDGRKKKETEGTNKLENVWAKINYEGKRILNQVSNQSRSSRDSSGPSTDFSPTQNESDNDEKKILPPANIQNSTELTEEYGSETEKTVESEKYETNENEQDLNDSLTSTEENKPELLEPSAPIAEEYPKLEIKEDENNANTSDAISGIPPENEERQEIQPHVRLAPSVEEELTTKRPSVGPPPSYSFVMKQKKKIKPVPSVEPLVIDTPPPPTYAGSRAMYLTPEERMCNFPSFAEPIWRSHSQPALCPRCGIIVLTTTHTHDSKATHVAALALCLFGCWPCCLLPYCMNVCKNTYHHCPICQTFLGLYRPW